MYVDMILGFMEEEKCYFYYCEIIMDKYSDKKYYIFLFYYKKKDSGYEYGVEDGKVKESVVEDYIGNGFVIMVYDKYVFEEEVMYNWDLKLMKLVDLEYKEKMSLKEKIKQKLYWGFVGFN